MIIIVVIAAILSTIGFVAIIAMIIDTVESSSKRKHHIKSKDVYDLIKSVIVKEIPYGNPIIHCSNDIIIEKTTSIVYPYYIRDIGYIKIFSKSSNLINSFCLSEKETNTLKGKKVIDKFWDKKKNN